MNIREGNSSLQVINNGNAATPTNENYPIDMTIPKLKSVYPIEIKESLSLKSADKLQQKYLNRMMILKPLRARKYLDKDNTNNVGVANQQNQYQQINIIQNQPVHSSSTQRAPIDKLTIQEQNSNKPSQKKKTGRNGYKSTRGVSNNNKQDAVVNQSGSNSKKSKISVDLIHLEQYSPRHKGTGVNLMLLGQNTDIRIPNNLTTLNVKNY